MAVSRPAQTPRGPGRKRSGRPTLPLADYTGTYVHPVWGDILVTLEGDHLTFRMGTNPEARGTLEHWSYDTFSAHLGDGRSDPVPVSFTVGPIGKATELRLAWPAGAVFQRKPS